MSTVSLSQNVQAKRESLIRTVGIFSGTGLVGVVVSSIGWAAGAPDVVNHVAFVIGAIGMAVGFSLSSVLAWLTSLKIPVPRETVHVETIRLQNLENQARTAPISSNGHKPVSA